MKRLSLVIGLLIFSAAWTPVALAGEWAPSNMALTSQSGFILPVKLTASSNASTDDSTCMFPVNSSLQGFRNTVIPLSMTRMKLSLIDISSNPKDKGAPTGHYSPLRLQMNAGLQTNRFSMTPSIGPSSEALSDGADWNATAYILFFGVNLDLGSGFIQTHGYMSPGLGNNGALALSGASGKPGIGMDTKGFNASAGYKFSDRLTLKAGCGYMDQKDKRSGASAEAWAIYAQAILSIAPGVKVIPGVGQIDFGKDQSGKSARDNFFAGAKWQINF